MSSRKRKRNGGLSYHETLEQALPGGMRDVLPCIVDFAPRFWVLDHTLIETGVKIELRNEHNDWRVVEEYKLPLPENGTEWQWKTSEWWSHRETWVVASRSHLAFWQRGASSWIVSPGLPVGRTISGICVYWTNRWLIEVRTQGEPYTSFWFYCPIAREWSFAMDAPHSGIGVVAQVVWRGVFYDVKLFTMSNNTVQTVPDHWSTEHQEWLEDEETPSFPEPVLFVVDKCGEGFYAIGSNVIMFPLDLTLSPLPTLFSHTFSDTYVGACHGCMLTSYTQVRGIFDPHWTFPPLPPASSSSETVRMLLPCLLD